MRLTLRIENLAKPLDGCLLEASLTHGTLHVGRSTSMDWCLPDPDKQISKHHFDVVFREDAYWLVDLSTNGVFINGQRNRLRGPYRLVQGDRLRVGNILISANMTGEQVAGLRATPAFEDASFNRPVAQEVAGPQGLHRPPASSGDDRLPVNLPPLAPVASDPRNDRLQPPAFASALTPMSRAAEPPHLQRPAGDFDRHAEASAALGLPPGQLDLPAASPALSQPARPPGLQSGPAFDSGYNGRSADPAAGLRSPPPAIHRPAPSQPASSGPPVSPLFVPPTHVNGPAPGSGTPAALQHPGQSPLSASDPPPPVPVPEIPQQVLHPAPAPSPINALSAPAENPFVSAFCDGAGLDPRSHGGVDPVQLAHALGRAMSVTVRQVMTLLNDRAATERFTEADQRTMTGPSDNNPLRSMSDPAGAIDALFLSPRDGSAKGESSLESAFGDVWLHQTALLAAMRPALMRLLADLAPDAIQGEAADRFQGDGSKVEAWDTFVNRWDAKVAGHDTGMLDAFLTHFAEAYAAAIAAGSRQGRG